MIPRARSSGRRRRRPRCPRRQALGNGFLVWLCTWSRECPQCAHPLTLSPLDAVPVRGRQVSPGVRGRHFARSPKRQTEIQRKKGGPGGGTVSRVGLGAEVGPGTPETASGTAGGRTGAGRSATRWALVLRAAGPPGAPVGSRGRCPGRVSARAPRGCRAARKAARGAGGP